MGLSVYVRDIRRKWEGKIFFSAQIRTAHSFGPLADKFWKTKFFLLFLVRFFYFLFFGAFQKWNFGKCNHFTFVALLGSNFELQTANTPLWKAEYQEILILENSPESVDPFLRNIASKLKNDCSTLNQNWRKWWGFQAGPRKDESLNIWSRTLCQNLVLVLFFFPEIFAF